MYVSIGDLSKIFGISRGTLYEIAERKPQFFVRLGSREVRITLKDFALQAIKPYPTSQEMLVQRIKRLYGAYLEIYPQKRSVLLPGLMEGISEYAARNFKEQSQSKKLQEDNKISLAQNRKL